MPAHPARLSRVQRATLFALFMLSGFAGLIYESLWTHYLKLFLGHAAYAQTLVLALFMGGMGAGAWLASRYSANWKNLLRGYAIAEALIGVAALMFHPLFVTVTDMAYTSWLPAAGGEIAAGLVKWSLAASLILPQTILLGMTFPLMSAGLIRRAPAEPGGTLAMLYFTNSFGAALGVLAAGFFLVERAGLPGTMQTAAALNLLIAILIWFAFPRSEKAMGVELQPAAASGGISLFLLVAALTGTASFIYEIGWIRMLSVVLGSSTHSFELMLSAFILGIASGSLWIKRRIDSIASVQRYLGMVQVAMGLLALATLPLYGQMFGLMGKVVKTLGKTDTGYSLFLLSSDAIALAVMFPAAFCAGMTLPLISAALLKTGHGERSIGMVYAANTAGSIVGIVIAAHLAMPLLGLKGMITAGAALDMALGIILLAKIRAKKPVWIAATASVLGVCLSLTLLNLDLYKMASGVFRRGDVYRPESAQLVYYKDGKTTSVSLLQFQEGLSLRTNGKSDGAINLNEGERISDEITMVMTGAIPLAYKPDARRAAVIGVGTGLTSHTLLSNLKLDAVDTVEIEPAMAEASHYFSERNGSVWADPRSRLIFDDAKTAFSLRNARYDIIVSEPSNPWVSGVASLFTTEFYRLSKRYLNEGGVLVQWLQMYETDISLLASVMKALGENFDDYVIYAANDSDLLIVAGDRATLSKPIADVTKIPGLARELARVQVRNLGDIELRRLGGRSVLEPYFQSFPVPANSDYYPYLDAHAAKFRFLQTDARQFVNFGIGGIPALPMLEQRPERSRPSHDGEEFMTRIELSRRAHYAHDFYIDPKPPEPLGLPRTLQKDLELTRLRGFECHDPQSFDIWFHSLYEIARLVNPWLTRAQNAEIWKKLETTPCYARLPAEYRNWIELFAAVGARDARQMASLGEALLGQSFTLPRGHRRYLLTAAMTGYLSLGEKPKALALWQRHGQSVRDEDDADPNLRLLQAHAEQAAKPPK
jgi:predicted membrane-bound spermidine synthase